DIWTYTVKCEKETAVVGGDGYRELSEMADGNFYVADSSLRFSFNNPYAEGPLSYMIASLKDGGDYVTGLPKLKMMTGLNKFKINLSENNAFRTGEEYVLRVILPNNHQ